MSNSTMNVSMIVKVYSGKPGCMCGCKGKWSSVSEGEIRSVKIIANKLARNENTRFDEQAQCFYFKDSKRTLAAYYADN